jgi:hypothetical protein
MFSPLESARSRVNPTLCGAIKSSRGGPKRVQSLRLRPLETASRLRSWALMEPAGGRFFGIGNAFSIPNEICGPLAEV